LPARTGSSSASSFPRGRDEAFALSSIVLVGLIAVTGRALVAHQTPAQGQPQGPNVANIEKVKDNLYMVTGGGGNTAVFVTGNGVVLVDTKLANWARPSWTR
jgi:hypothetical protein